MSSEAPMNTRGYLGDLYARALTWNRYFQRALGLAALLIIGQQVQIFRLTERLSVTTPVFVRVDELGRHDILNYEDATDGKPRANELRTALRTFTRLHFSRTRSTVSRDFHESLYFLKDGLADEAMRVTKVKEIDPFNASVSADEIEIENINPKLTQLDTSPYHAEIAFDKVFYQTGTRLVHRPSETFVLYLTFELLKDSPNEYLQINPWHIRISAMRLEPAFKQPQQAMK
jgi:hypothetical protein